MEKTNKDEAIKIKKLLGLNGEKSKYYRTTDVLIALMHYCDYYKNKQPDEQYYTFDEQLEHAREGYLQNINDYQE